MYNTYNRYSYPIENNSHYRTFKERISSVSKKNGDASFKNIIAKLNRNITHNQLRDNLNVREGEWHHKRQNIIKNALWKEHNILVQALEAKSKLNKNAKYLWSGYPDENHQKNHPYDRFTAKQHREINNLIKKHRNPNSFQGALDRLIYRGRKGGEVYGQKAPSANTRQNGGSSGSPINFELIRADQECSNPKIGQVNYYPEGTGRPPYINLNKLRKNTRGPRVRGTEINIPPTQAQPMCRPCNRVPQRVSHVPFTSRDRARLYKPPCGPCSRRGIQQCNHEISKNSRSKTKKVKKVKKVKRKVYTSKSGARYVRRVSKVTGRGYRVYV